MGKVVTRPQIEDALDRYGDSAHVLATTALSEEVKEMRSQHAAKLAAAREGLAKRQEAQARKQQARDEMPAGPVEKPPTSDGSSMPYSPEGALQANKQKVVKTDLPRSRRQIASILLPYQGIHLVSFPV